MIALAFTTAMAFSTIPTPLYALYQARDGFPTYVVTIVFAAYAVGVAISLYLAGHVSDWLGRRRVILVALAVELLAAAIFLIWPQVPGLIVARFVSGVGIGILTATATAHLSELHAVARPGAGPSRAGVVSSLANIGGLSLGPLIAGLIATFAPAPLVTPFVVFAVLLVLGVLFVAGVPETVERGEERRAYRPQRVAVPAAGRATFWAAGAGAFGGFSIFGLFMSLTPTVLAVSMGLTARWIAGGVPFLFFAAAALAQVATVRMPLRRQLILALVMLVVGIVLFTASVVIAFLPLFLIGGIVAGAGVGVLFRSSLGVGGALAPAGRRGEVLAAIFLISYVGLAVPTLLIGVALVWFPLVPVLLVFAVLVLALALWATPRMIRRA
ncbi:MFS transporter [Galbitalea sp. SE-J8]|uniref:MFS transporter n=1 Tax=Galbitalea sp. SE-J8 TaxID=3054952 RepID=UPI00259CDC32|nr:MFS transporter [Galbitalea sp. SE-J8]